MSAFIVTTSVQLVYCDGVSWVVVSCSKHIFWKKLNSLMEKELTWHQDEISKYLLGLLTLDRSRGELLLVALKLDLNWLSGWNHKLSTRSNTQIQSDHVRLSSLFLCCWGHLQANLVVLSLIVVRRLLKNFVRWFLDDVDDVVRWLFSLKKRAVVLNHWRAV